MKRTDRQQEVIDGVRDEFLKWILEKHLIGEFTGDDLNTFLECLKERPYQIKQLLFSSMHQLALQYVMKTGEALIVNDIRTPVDRVVAILSSYYSEELAAL